MTRGHHGKHQRVILARATNKPSDADGHRLHRHDPDIALSKRDSCDTHDTPPHKRAAAGGSDVVVERIDSAIVPAALVRSPCPREVGHRPLCTVGKWYRYLARDPPSYDSGIPVSEADAKRMMDKIEARSMWLKADGKAPKILGKQAQVKLCVECVETTKAYKGRQSAYEQHCWQSSSWHSWRSSQT